MKTTYRNREYDYLVDDKNVLNQKEMVLRLRAITKLTKRDCVTFVKAFKTVLKQAMLEGRVIPLNGLGKIKYRRLSDRRVKTVFTNNIARMVPGWDKPILILSAMFRKEVRAESWKRLEEKESYGDHVKRVIKTAAVTSDGGKG